MRVGKLIAAATLLWAGALVVTSPTLGVPAASSVVYAAEDRDRDRNHGNHEGNLDRDLAAVLSAEGFTGDIERTFRKRLEKNLGRKIDPKLVDLGRMLWFDKIHSLRRDNTCGGCHSPTNAFGDSQPMAIGVQNNNLVGPDRQGPRNQRRTPAAVNIALYPALMWNGRFNSLSGDPFDNSLGFRFPSAEGDIRFSLANDIANHISHLAQAQGEMPPTELTEAAGYTGTCPNGIPDPTLGPRFCQFDDGLGLPVPMPEPGEDGSFSRNNPIRREALKSLNGSAAYRRLFGEVFPEVAGSHGKPIDFHMFGRAIAEFEFTLVFADAPLDQFARGDRDAMTSGEKRGALLFFGKAGCATCHYVTKKESSDPEPNEMFSDFEEHVIGVPQIAPRFGKKKGNTIFDGPGEDEDFGLAQVTGSEQDRYKFRTAPLRNLALAPAFFHNGAFINLEDAIRFHLNVHEEGKKYDPIKAGVPDDLAHRLGPVVPKRLLDPLVQSEIKLTDREVNDLVKFVRDGLLDKDATNLCHLIPRSVPSGLPVMVFQGCQ
jgi:cytochrome c peroxidase